MTGISKLESSYLSSGYLLILKPKLSVAGSSLFLTAYLGGKDILHFARREAPFGIGPKDFNLGSTRTRCAPRRRCSSRQLGWHDRRSIDHAAGRHPGPTEDPTVTRLGNHALGDGDLYAACRGTGQSRIVPTRQGASVGLTRARLRDNVAAWSRVRKKYRYSGAAALRTGRSACRWHGDRLNLSKQRIGDMRALCGAQREPGSATHLSLTERKRMTGSA